MTASRNMLSDGELISLMSGKNKTPLSPFHLIVLHEHICQGHSFTINLPFQKSADFLI